MMQPRRVGALLLAMVLLLAACIRPTENTPETVSPPAESLPVAESPVSVTTTETPPAETPATPPTPDEPCIPAGDQTGIQAALSGVGAKAVLCPDAVFELTDTVNFTDDDQAIYTQGFPIDDSRALLRVSDPGVDTAISAEAHSGVKLSHVIIDGNRPELGSGIGGLIEFGGAASGQVVEWVKAYEPRGWSVLVINEGHDRLCTGAVARYNELGPAGHSVYGISDGISLACRDSIITDNTITDVTDGGIVIFQAPGSLVANNTIRAVNRVMFYGISMEDYGPFDGDFTGTRVTGNTIDAQGSLIRRAISMGPNVGCIPTVEATLRSRGAVVSDNRLIGDNMGYGFVVGGVEDWTVTGNVDDSTHLVPWKEQDCFGEIADAPAGFQYNAAISSGTFQDEYEDSVLAFTTNWWRTNAALSEECLTDLVGESLMADIKAGQRSPVWEALENAENGARLESCLTEKPMPTSAPSSAEVIVWVEAAGPFEVEVVLANVGESGTADLSQAEFYMEGFLVECRDLPASVAPGDPVRCVIEDYVAEGFQILWWLGIPSLENEIGFNYPFED